MLNQNTQKAIYFKLSHFQSKIESNFPTTETEVCLFVETKKSSLLIFFSLLLLLKKEFEPKSKRRRKILFCFSHLFIRPHVCAVKFPPTFSSSSFVSILSCGWEKLPQKRYHHLFLPSISMHSFIASMNNEWMVFRWSVIDE